ncbi:MAG TPA: DUF362 domain-containing protein [Lacunisphaera sp.]|jgi:uncharacterized protein (DUF362 family)|nr:DUF362 domain-containing protein [Lacunisphaera sp.]
MPTRREFLKSGLALGAAVSLPGWRRLAAAETAAAAAPKPILVAVRDGTRPAMLDAALKALGGLGAFVRPGQTVCLKPNIGWDAPPERGADTHPELVGHLTRLCLAAGAKSVAVFDNTCDQWQRCYENSGIEQAARAAGAQVVNGKDRSLYREVEIPGGVSLKRALVHSLVLDSDVLLNVPVLKHHSGTGMTAAMKNLMGCIWDRGFYHQNNVHQAIADFLLLRKPTLNILDAYHPMVRNGPRGKTVDDVVEMRLLLASTDPVALDAAAARTLGLDPATIAYIRLGAELKLGISDLEAVDVRRVSLA